MLTLLFAFSLSGIRARVLIDASRTPTTAPVNSYPCQSNVLVFVLPIVLGFVLGFVLASLPYC